MAKLQALQKVPNVRDLASACTLIAPGLVFRCANPSEATAEDVAALLLGMNIRDMIDLRSGEEVLDDPARNGELFGGVDTINYVRSWWAPGQARPVRAATPAPPATGISKAADAV